MELWVFSAILYVSSILFAAVMTFREQRRKAQPGGVYSVIGLLACSVWPLIAVVCVFTSLLRFEQEPHNAR